MMNFHRKGFFLGQQLTSRAESPQTGPLLACLSGSLKEAQHTARVSSAARTRAAYGPGHGRDGPCFSPLVSQHTQLPSTAVTWCTRLSNRMTMSISSKSNQKCKNSVCGEKLASQKTS